MLNESYKAICKNPIKSAKFIKNIIKNRNLRVGLREFIVATSQVTSSLSHIKRYDLQLLISHLQYSYNLDSNIADSDHNLYSLTEGWDYSVHMPLVYPGDMAVCS